MLFLLHVNCDCFFYTGVKFREDFYSRVINFVIYLQRPWKLMYQSNRSFNIPPRACPGHLTSFPAREGGNLINLVFPGAGI